MRGPSLASEKPEPSCPAWPRLSMQEQTRGGGTIGIPDWRERVGDWKEGTAKISGHTEDLIRAIIKDLRFAAENDDEQKKLELFRQHLLEALPTVMPMVHAGLIEWAFKQMGSSYPKYLTQAFGDWMALSQLLQDSVGIDALEALMHTPFNFPLRARKNPRLTFSRLNENTNRSPGN